MRLSLRNLNSLYGLSALLIVPLTACSSSSTTETSGGDAGSDHESPPADSGRDTEPNDAGRDVSPSDTGSSDTSPPPDDGGTEAGQHDGSSDGSIQDGSAPFDGPVDGAVDGSTDAHADGATDAESDAHADSADGATGTLVQNYFVGRWDLTGVTAANTATGIGAVANWPGSGVITTFLGDTIGLTLTDACNPTSSQCDSISIELDGTLISSGAVINGTVVLATSFALASGNTTVELNNTLYPQLSTAAKHTIGIFKNTESFYGGAIAFGGFAPASGLATNNPPEAYSFSHRIEWIGDEITSGHGTVDTPSPPTTAQCMNPESPTTGVPTSADNEYLSYAAVTSKHFGAERQNLSIATVGVAQGLLSGSPVVDVTATSVWPFVDPKGTGPAWTAASWVPDLVVVNLGSYGDLALTQDSDDPTPGTDDTTLLSAYVTAYETLLRSLRAEYSAAPILIVSGDAWLGQIDPTGAYDIVQTVVNERTTGAGGETLGTTLAYYQAPLASPSTEFTCGQYPDSAAQATLATGVEAAITSLTHWTAP